MNKGKDESYISYLKRVTEYKKIGRIDYKTWGDLTLGEDNPYCSENLRKAWRIVSLLLEKVDENEMTEDDLIKQLSDMKDEIYKEKVKLRDQRRELSKLLTSEARYENLRDLMIERLNEIGNLPRETYYEKSDKVLGATLILSDIHYGIKIDNQFNYYDTEVCEDRLNEIVFKTIQKCKLHGVTKLNVEILGDVISGVIQVGCRVQQEEDIISQVIGVSDLLSNAICTLSEHIETVNVYIVAGNHGRVNANKKESIYTENFERLIAEFIKHRVLGVRVIDSTTGDFIKYTDFGKTFIVMHGHNDKASGVINDFMKIFKEEISEVHMGHYHNFTETNEYDIPVVINGSLVGTDDYAISIRKISKPMQVLKIYGEDECTYKLYTK